MTQDIRAQLGLRPVINVSGTMTSLGASIVVPEAVEAVTKVLTQFVELGDLHRKASQAIAELTGAEAGFVTASCSAAISLAVAAAITGDNLWAIEQLPDTGGAQERSADPVGPHGQLWRAGGAGDPHGGRQGGAGGAGDERLCLSAGRSDQ